MPDYRRHRLPGGCYFFTVALHARRGNDLLTREIGRLRRAVGTVRRARPFAVEAWVVLPDHLHAVWTLPEGDDDFPTRWRLIKTIFARGLPATEPRSAVRLRRRERAIWQRRYWEHRIRDAADFARHVDYVHFNPVRHGHVAHPAAWPYSSFAAAVARGVYPADWAAPPADLPAGEPFP